jgi:hypothetical protein
MIIMKGATRSENSTAVEPDRSAAPAKSRRLNDAVKDPRMTISLPRLAADVELNEV